MTGKYFGKNFIMLFFCSLIYSNSNAAAIEFPVYGNWCGPGYPAEGENPTPLDIVDAACKEHDIKYGHCEQEKDRLICEAAADLEIVYSLRNDVNKLDRPQLIVANQLGRYFSVQAPVKVETDKVKKLFNDRIQVSTELQDLAEHALVNAGDKLNIIKTKLIHLKDFIVDNADNLTDSVVSKYNSTVGSASD